MHTMVLVRHGESEWNKKNLFTGWTDVDLSERGWEEAKNAGILMKAAGMEFDVCYTSYLKRAIHTANVALEAMDAEWIEVKRSWRLNERHYGGLQGLNKAETAEKYGEDQVFEWRRSYAVRPPALDANDPRNPAFETRYSGTPKEGHPLTESLKDTVERVIPYFSTEMCETMAAGKRIVVFAHGNSIRALVKHLDGLTDEEISGVNIPTGVPLVYELNDEFEAISSRYLGDADEIAARKKAVEKQGSAQK